MPGRCVVGHCPNVKDKENGIYLHRIPYFDRPEAKRRRKKWVDFVLRTRKNWSPSEYSVVCSAHFRANDYSRKFVALSRQNAYLNRDSFGLSAVPSVLSGNNVEELQQETERAARARRKDQQEMINSLLESVSVDKLEQEAEAEICDAEPEEVGGEPEEIEENEAAFKDMCVQTENAKYKDVDTQMNFDCHDCKRLNKKNRQLRNLLISSKEKLKNCRAELKRKEKKDHQSTPANQHPSTSAEPVASLPQPIEEDMKVDEDSDYEVMEEEPEYKAQASEEDQDTEESDSDEDTGGRVYIRDDNLRTEPKYVVFLSQLLMLFQFCQFCKHKDPLVEAREVGTMAEVSTVCSNPKCRKESKWRSQPNIPGTKIPAGNYLLCFSILASGGFASKVLCMFKHMGLACFSLRTFFTHQHNILFPSILIHWKQYQAKKLQELKALASGIAIAGNGRHDSMGHSAKYCAYTIFCCTVPMIIHFALVQRNEAGNSPGMEYMAFVRCMTFLLGCGMAISTFISDRHSTIIKHMREKLPNIIHYFDLWHLKKKIHKVLTKISKLSGCEAVKEWIQPCENHFYWSAKSTITGNGQVIWAKFKSFLGHIVNKHTNLDEPLFNKCSHGDDISERKWLEDDSTEYEKVTKALTDAKLVAAIKKASPLDQTSSLEGFHSVLNQFAPKMISYSFAGMFCRHVIAIIHFNQNLQRERVKRPDGTYQVVFVYPKFKNGEATVRDVRINPIFDYVEEIYKTSLQAISAKTLGVASQELKEMSPAPMNTMLNKQSREEALQKRDRRRDMVMHDVPPTTPVEVVNAQQETEAATRQASQSREKPHCSVCKHPMKGHNKRTDCPKNHHS